MIDRRLFINFDLSLIVIVLMLAAIGVINLYSAIYSYSRDIYFPLYLRQFLWIAIGLGIMIISLVIDYRIYDRYAYLIMAFSIALLMIVLITGRSISGSRRWLDLGFISFQPSEFSKIAVILSLTHYFQRKESPTGYSGKHLLFPLSLIGLVLFLILMEPDLGTAAVVGMIAFSMILFVGIRLRALVILICLHLITLPFVWLFLKDYQKKRVMTFLNPDLDPLGAGYHLIQSKIAVGSGGLWGKGYLQGTQNQLRFLPEQHTDFIFSVLAEEWGFLGAFFVMAVFLLLFLYALRITSRARDNAGAIMGFGIVSMFFWPTVINIGMTIGLLPVVGVPIPFLSYGGSSMVSVMLGVGILMNISMRRHVF